MRYMLLIYGNEADAATMTQEEREALMQGHAAFAQEALARCAVPSKSVQSWKWLCDREVRWRAQRRSLFLP